MLAEIGWPEVGLALVSALPALIAAFVAAMISWHNATQIKHAAEETKALDAKLEVVHKATNSMKDELVRAATRQGYSDGTADEKAKTENIPSVAVEHVKENIVALEENTNAIKASTKKLPGAK